MRFEVYDEEGKLFRKFWERWEAVKFIQPGWKIVEKAKHRPVPPNPTTHGRALW